VISIREEIGLLVGRVDDSASEATSQRATKEEEERERELLRWRKGQRSRPWPLVGIIRGVLPRFAAAGWGNRFLLTSLTM